jgi:hypothetical protein
MGARQGVGSVESGGGAVIMGDVRLSDGTLIGRDQINHYYHRYVTQVFSPRVGGQASPPKRPFLGDRPFGTEDCSLFTCREAEIGRVLGRFRDGDQNTAVIYGPADVGKTSFVSAGLLPRFDEAGAEVIPLRDYRHAAPILRALLRGRAEQLGATGLAQAEPPELVWALLRATPMQLVLVLDQFERLFWPDVTQAERDDLREELRGILESAAPQRLRVLVAIRDDYASRLDREWGELLPCLRELPVHVLPLSHDEARRAILEPVKVYGRQPGFVSSFVEDRLLPDLDKLSPGQPGLILPADLQIACQGLYEEATAQQCQAIDTELYYEITEGKGAEWLQDRHFRGLWARVEGPRRELGEELARELLSRGRRPESICVGQAWVEPGQLALAGRDRGEIEQALEEMVRVGLLIWHIAGGERAYAFATESTARAVERTMGRAAQKRLQAQEELAYAWQDWLADDRLAGRYQLDLLEEHFPDALLAPEKALLLLRSAVTAEQPVEHWLGRLETAESRLSIAELERAEPWTGKAVVRLAGQWNEIGLLGLDEEGLPERPESETFGQVSWVAAIHRQWQVRETAVLALWKTHGQEALARVEAAVGASTPGQRRNLEGRLVPASRRLAELRGVLADADAGMEQEIRKGSRRERFDTWYWRFRRRFRRDRVYIGAVALGGGVGAALSLGLLRALLAPFAVARNPGFYFYASLPPGFLLAFALSAGLQLAATLGLQRLPLQASASGRMWQLRAVVCAALAFGLMHLALISLFQPGVVLDKPLLAPLALVAGAGLGAAVYDQPRAGACISAGRWFARLAMAAVALALVQAVLVLAELRLGRSLGTTLHSGWSSNAFDRGPEGALAWLGLGRVYAIEHWRHYAAIVEEALAGLALAGGLAIGMRVARDRYQRWAALVRRAGE